MARSDTILGLHPAIMYINTIFAMEFPESRIHHRFEHHLLAISCAFNNKHWMFSTVIFIVLITGKDRSTKKFVNSTSLWLWMLIWMNQIIFWSDIFPSELPHIPVLETTWWKQKMIKRYLHSHTWSFRALGYLFCFVWFFCGFFPWGRGIKRKWFLDR